MCSLCPHPKGPHPRKAQPVQVEPTFSLPPWRDEWKYPGSRGRWGLDSRPLGLPCQMGLSGGGSPNRTLPDLPSLTWEGGAPAPSLTQHGHLFLKPPLLSRARSGTLLAPLSSVGTRVSLGCFLLFLFPIGGCTWGGQDSVEFCISSQHSAQKATP